MKLTNPWIRGFYQNIYLYVRVCEIILEQIPDPTNWHTTLREYWRGFLVCWEHGPVQ